MRVRPMGASQLKLGNGEIEIFQGKRFIALTGQGTGASRGIAAPDPAKLARVFKDLGAVVHRDTGTAPKPAPASPPANSTYPFEGPKDAAGNVIRLPLPDRFKGLPIEHLFPLTEKDVDEIRSAVMAIPPSELEENKGWMDVARPIAHEAWLYPEHQEVLYAILDEASKRSPKNYNVGKNRTEFERFIREARTHGDKARKIGSLFHQAMQHGWRSLPAPVQSAPAVPATERSELTSAGTGVAAAAGIAQPGAALPIQGGISQSAQGLIQTPQPAGQPWTTQSLTAGLAVTFANTPHRQFLYGVDLSRGEITVSAAPGGSGKSSLAIGVCACLVSNNALLKEKIWAHEPKVLYVNGEDDAAEITRRVWAFCLKHGLSEQNIKNLSLIGADDWRAQKLSFLRTQGTASVLDQNGFDFLEELLGVIRPDLLVLDSLISFCGGGNVNDNAVMGLVMKALKRLANKFKCAVLILHHTRKGGDLSSAEAISGASSIVNLARRAIMIVPMAKDEAAKLGVLPSEASRHFKIVSAKSNLAPPAHVCPWYKLDSVTLPNPEPPTYPNGDNVQAVVRVQLPIMNRLSDPDDLKIKRAIADVVQRGKIIGGQPYPYSPSTTSARNERALADDAVEAAAKATAPKQWQPGDLHLRICRRRGRRCRVLRAASTHPRRPATTLGVPQPSTEKDLEPA
jgi:hypothetical protein